MIYKSITIFPALLLACPLVQAREQTDAPSQGCTNPVTTLPVVMVVAPQESPDCSSSNNPSGYSPLDAKGATRTDAPIMQTPVSEQVISQQVLKDQQTIYLDDALQNVSGVTPANDSYGTGDSFSIRGFECRT